MNLPNKLTVVRILLIPLLVATLLINFPMHNAVALIIFIVASITDMLDGKIARKRNLVTTFGKFADPIADKLLVLSALLCFLQLGLCDSIAILILLFREFSVTSIRLIAASSGKVVAANIWGKVKTVTQIIAIISVLTMQSALDLFNLCFNFNSDLMNLLTNIFTVSGIALIWISTVFAIISGVIYIIQNRHFISEK